MGRWIRAATIAAVLSVGLLVPAFVGQGTAWAGVSLGDFCGD